MIRLCVRATSNRGRMLSTSSTSAFVLQPLLLRRSVGCKFVSCRLTTKATASCGSECVSSMTRFGDAFSSEPGTVFPVVAVTKEGYASWLEVQSQQTKAWLSMVKFDPKNAGAFAILPKFSFDEVKAIDGAVIATGSEADVPWTYADLPNKLPGGQMYELRGDFNSDAATLGWALGSYSFLKYKSKKPKAEKPRATLNAKPSGPVSSAISATYLVRDLINHHADDMCPEQLEAAARSLAEKHDASCETIVGDDLLTKNFPLVHAVGRAAMQNKCKPRLIDIRWGSSSKPQVTLVGKGVCYDTGGLNLKPGAAMRNMKKDMGGAATVLGLASMIMQNKLDISLRVIIPAVENAISGNSFRPGDIVPSRKGLNTEIDNTDAEGRLILADALALACEEKPQLVIDCATLTGAQRVALGTDIPSSFCSNSETGRKLFEYSQEQKDLIWELPLHKPYRRMLDSNIADIKNSSAGGYAGAITAALYLKEFVTDQTEWIHIDHMGYNPSSRPGRPEGGEAQGMRALYELIKREFCT
mmetsp:Transcript_5698/g.16956  ORF Transcript_5698/g.16956 Transcript_5698/m.16956 type:complete len:529 (-) Transcript_5698:87-1673(-)